MATSSTLSQTQRYAAGALLALALRQAQIHQSVLLGSHGLDDAPAAAAAVPSLADPVDARHLWTHDSHGLLRPVLRYPSPNPIKSIDGSPLIDEFLSGFSRSTTRHGRAWRRRPPPPSPSTTSEPYAPQCNLQCKTISMAIQS